MKKIKKAVLLHDLCAVGKAAMTNMMPVMAALGVEACPVPTVLLSTHTGGYGKPAICPVNTQYIRDCAAHFKEQGISFDAIFAGYAGSPDMVLAMQDFIRAFPDVPVFLDPIMGDHGSYYGNFDAFYGQAVSGLLSVADVILPNLTEACLLSHTPYRMDFTKEEIKNLCRKLDTGEKQQCTVILTSVPNPKGQQGIALYRRTGQERTCSLYYLEEACGSFHGTGDLFDGVVLSGYVLGKEMEESIRQAHAFVYHCITADRPQLYDEREGIPVEQFLSFFNEIKSN